MCQTKLGPQLIYFLCFHLCFDLLETPSRSIDFNASLTELKVYSLPFWIRHFLILRLPLFSPPLSIYSSTSVISSFVRKLTSFLFRLSSFMMWWNAVMLKVISHLFLRNLSMSLYKQPLRKQVTINSSFTHYLHPCLFWDGSKKQKGMRQNFHILTCTCTITMNLGKYLLGRPNVKLDVLK